MQKEKHNKLLIFVKNKEIGKVKTRLAKTIGDSKALLVYEELLRYTKQITEKLPCAKTVLYSNEVDNEDVFSSQLYHKLIQNTGDLGERMKVGFNDAFDSGAKSVIVIGSDCYQLTHEQIENAFFQLQSNDVVIGPAEDGGYYLLGLNNKYNFLFENKSWSTSILLEETERDLVKHKLNYKFLPVLSDIDNYDDLKKIRSLLQLIER